MKRRVLACLMVTGILAAGCAGKGSDTTASTAASTAPGGARTPAKFGTLDNPCGKRDKPATIKASDAGTKADKFYIGVPNDRDFSVSPGLLKEMWDTSNAFAAWCNEAGGLAGVPIELIDLDAQFSNVQQVMGTACSQTFALVGGGWVQDQNMFSQTASSDFKACKLIDVPSFAVSPEVTDGERIVQPVPNPAYDKPATWLVDLPKLFPDKTKKLVVAYGEDGGPLHANMAAVYAVAKLVPGNPWGIGDPISYNALKPDIPALARQVKESQATAVQWVGAADYLAGFAGALRTVGYDGILFADAQGYDPLVINSASDPKSVEGLLARTAIHPFQERDRWPAIAQFMDIQKEFNKGKGDSPLAVQSFSAWLFFGQAVNKCADKGEVSRDCVLEEMESVHAWNGGGLHATTDPGKNLPSPCSMLMRIHDGAFERFYPKLDSKEASADEQFSCPTPGIITIPKS